MYSICRSAQVAKDEELKEDVKAQRERAWLRHKRQIQAPCRRQKVSIRPIQIHSANL